MALATEPFYRRNPRKALKGIISLSLEEVGVYNILLDMMYDTWNPLPFDSKNERSYVLRWIPAAPQKVNPIIKSLIAKGRLLEKIIDGKIHLSDDAFEVELYSYTGREVKEKSDRSQGEVGEKSDRSTPLLDHTIEENQQLADTEENRIEEDKKEKKEEEKKESFAAVKSAQKVRRGGGAVAKALRGRKGTRAPVPIEARWSGDPIIRKRVVALAGEGFAKSYLDSAVQEGMLVLCATKYARQKLCALIGGVFDTDDPLFGLAVITRGSG